LTYRRQHAEEFAGPEGNGGEAAYVLPPTICLRLRAPTISALWALSPALAREADGTYIAKRGNSTWLLLWSELEGAPDDLTAIGVAVHHCPPTPGPAT
jgi:hypothetical protein